MKSLLVIRHAKSSWDNTEQKDFDRPLNARGHRDAPEMASRLLKKNIVIDAFIASTANRAFSTAGYFADAYQVAHSAIIRVPALYHAGVPVFYDVVKGADNAFDTIAIFSHNPGITDFVNTLTPSTRIDDMPTCAIFAVQTDITDWKDFQTAVKRFWFFDYPKA
ncbi:SixA phosphatase family protein [Deminuibacter soli]|uniref:Histidine phosphatase family protein n=1 Tax=Deminuibacter soli TaxID=2291815 RepID=A0A3E1NRT4_9BACT|nr:histidine phosphatase family protein [Deminuibacter soli]RFM30622.1 histidine phosphatase family protein [Deminuibacter soli]